MTKSTSTKNKRLEKKRLKRICRAIARHDCVLFLGPDLFRTVEENGSLSQSIYEMFSRELFDCLELKDEEKKQYDPDDLSNHPYIAQRFLSENGREYSGRDLSQDFADYVNKHHKNRPYYYELIAELPFDFVVNTCCDHFLIEAFNNKSKDAKLVYFKYTGGRYSFSEEPSEKNPIVYNLFGHYEKTPEALVLSSEQQVNFITKIMRGDSAIPDEVKVKIKDRSELLFLGFGKPSWQLPLLFHALNLGDRDIIKDKKVLYLEEAARAAIPLTQRHFYEDVFTFTFQDEDYEEFIKSLSDAYEELETRPEVKLNSKIYPNEIQFRNNGKTKILVLKATPDDLEKIDVDGEIEIIKKEAERSDVRDKIDVGTDLQASADNFNARILKMRPEILHFAGHGKNGRLVLRSESGGGNPVRKEAIARALGEHKDTIACVILNACSTVEQGRAIAENIANVIVTNRAIEDNSAKKFSRAFYQALFSGESYLKAYQIALSSLDLMGMNEDSNYVFFREGKKVSSDD